MANNKDKEPTHIPVTAAFLQEAIMFAGRTEKIINSTKMPGVIVTYIPEWNLLSFDKKGVKTHYLPITNAKHFELA